MKTIFLIGVTCSGKSTIGSEIAKLTGRNFVDGDDFHSTYNKQKMSSGESLVDADREPWLRNINEYCRSNPGVLVACSALKAKYRDVLRENIECCFIYLHVDRNVLEQRSRSRKNHFMPSSLLDSQLETWEDPNGESDVFTISFDNRNVSAICDEIIEKVLVN